MGGRNFVISDFEDGEFSLDSVKESLPLLLGTSELAFRRTSDGRNILLTVDGPIGEAGNLEMTIAGCFEMNGHLVSVTCVHFDSLLCLDFNGEPREVDELATEMLTAEAFLNSNAEAIDIRALVMCQRLGMILVVLASPYDENLTKGNFEKIDGLTAAYKLGSYKFLEIIFGDEEDLEGHPPARIWSRSGPGDHHARRGICHSRGVRPFKNVSDSSGKKMEKSHTVAIEGELSSEKCRLLDGVCRKLSGPDCLLLVDHMSLEVRALGKNELSFAQPVELLKMQLEMFHCGEIPGLSDKMFRILTETLVVRSHFEKILAENHFEGVILVRNVAGRPAVLGLNRVKTRNFVEWLQRFLVKETIRSDHHQHNEPGRKELEERLSLLEQNRWLSIELSDGAVVIHGLASDFFAVIDDVKDALSKFQHIPLDKDRLKFIDEVGIHSISCQALLSGGCACLYARSEEDIKELMDNTWRRRTLYASPVLFEPLQHLIGTRASLELTDSSTKITINCSSEDGFKSYTRAWNEHVERNYLVAIFHGRFDYPKTISTLAENYFFYEINSKEDNVIIFGKAVEIANAELLLKRCLLSGEESDTGADFSLFDMNSHLYACSMEHQDFDIVVPVKRYHLEAEPDPTRLSFYPTPGPKPPAKCIVS